MSGEGLLRLVEVGRQERPATVLLEMSSVFEGASYYDASAGWFLLPEGETAPATWLWSGAGWSELTDCDLVPIPEERLEKEEIGAWRVQRWGAPRDAGAAAPSPAGLSRANLAARIGLCLRVRDAITAHLEPRTSQGGKTLQHQAVTLSLAETALQLQAAITVLRNGPSDSGLPQSALNGLHRDVTRATWGLAKLMGGHGYLEGGVSRFGYLSALLGTPYSVEANHGT